MLHRTRTQAFRSASAMLYQVSYCLLDQKSCTYRACYVIQTPKCISLQIMHYGKSVLRLEHSREVLEVGLETKAEQGGGFGDHHGGAGGAEDQQSEAEDHGGASREFRVDYHGCDIVTREHREFQNGLRGPNRAIRGHRRWLPWVWWMPPHRGKCVPPLGMPAACSVISSGSATLDVSLFCHETVAVAGMVMAAEVCSGPSFDG